jgi:hypothetical protein
MKLMFDGTKLLTKFSEWYKNNYYQLKYLNKLTTIKNLLYHLSIAAAKLAAAAVKPAPPGA